MRKGKDRQNIELKDGAELLVYGTVELFAGLERFGVPDMARQPRKSALRLHPSVDPNSTHGESGNRSFRSARWQRAR